MYCYVLITFKAILTLSNQHYMPPPDFCQSAKVCNHTGISICGIQNGNSNKRIFLDDCDMYEYNCDYRKEYYKTDDIDCPKNETITLTTTSVKETTKQNISTKGTTTTKLATTTNISVTASITESEIINATVTTTGTPLLNGSISNSTCQCPTSTCPSLDSTNSSLKIDDTTTSITTILNITAETAISPNTIEIITSTSSFTTQPTTATLSDNSSTTFIETNPELTPINCTRSVAKSTMPITKTTTTLSSLSPSTEKTMATTVEYEKENDNTILGKETTISPNSCETYPRHCNRPHTWETTLKGETRDFFQILKAQYGSQVKLLRATTHYPQHISRPYSYDDKDFQFGQHNES